MRLHVQQAQFEHGEQSARTRANNQHIGFDHFAHVVTFSVEPFLVDGAARRQGPAAFLAKAEGTGKR
jgi:hypothetical protein